MSIYPFKHFLVVYRRSSKRLLEGVRAFDDPERAWEERLREEIAHRGDPDVEVVLLGASSEEALHSTHGRYFKSLEKLADELRETLAG